MKSSQSGTQLSQAVWMQVRPCVLNRFDLAGATPVWVRVTPFPRESRWNSRKA